MIIRTALRPFTPFVENRDSDKSSGHSCDGRNVGETKLEQVALALASRAYLPMCSTRPDRLSG
jgi:hypothetical protein